MADDKALLSHAWDLFSEDDDSSISPSDQNSDTCRRCARLSSECRDFFVQCSIKDTRSPVTLIKLADMPGIGGERGFVAARHLPPGVCVLAEVPVCVWPQSCEWDTPEGQREAIQTILQNPKAVATTKRLHPRQLDDVSMHDITRMRDIHGVTLQQLSTDTNTDENELVRLLLVLEHNGFSSGLYDRLSMFNHSCQSNCVKFSTDTNTGGASEVWTIRHVAEGEELCICYCSPVLQLETTIRKYLREQHCFDCACTRCRSSADDGLLCVCPTDTDIEANVVPLQKQIESLENDIVVDELPPSLLFERLEALISTATGLLLPYHFLWVRIYQIEADISAAALADNDNDIGSAVRFVRANFTVLPLMAKYLGGYHPDLATVHHDIYEGINSLINRAPTVLLKECSDLVGSTIVDARVVANKHLAMKHRIAQMYDTHRHFREAAELSVLGQVVYGQHIPVCVTPHVPDITMYDIESIAAPVQQLCTTTDEKEEATQVVDSELQKHIGPLLHLTVFGPLQDVLPTLVSSLEQEGAVLWPTAFSSHQATINQLRDQMDTILQTVTSSYDFETDTFRFQKGQLGVTRIPRVGHGKHNIHFDAYNSEGHTILSTLAELGQFAKILSEYQQAPCCLSEVGISITKPNANGTPGEGMEWHSDGGPGACTVLMCLHDVTPEQGYLGIIPRSHVQYQAGEEYDIASAGTEPLYYPYRAAVPMIIDARTVHRATDNVSNDWRAIFWFIFDCDAEF